MRSLARAVALALLAALGIVATLVALAAVRPALAAVPTQHEVKVATFQFGFTPNVIRVNVGDEVLVHLSSRDVAHGFYLDGYALQASVDAGQTKDIRFVASRPGTYRFRCAVTCGSLHPFMIGELVVEPNVPFGAAAALVLATGLGGYLWAIRRAEGPL